MTSEKAPELLPCPFCGGKAELFSNQKYMKMPVVREWAECVDCAAGTVICDADRNAAITAWNTRSDIVAAKDARIAELEAALFKIAGKAPYADDPWSIARAALNTQKGG